MNRKLNPTQEEEEERATSMKLKTGKQSRKSMRRGEKNSFLETADKIDKPVA